MKEKMRITDKIKLKLRRKKKMEDRITLKGDVVLELRKKDGSVIEKEELTNLIVSLGKERVARLIGGVGSGVTAFTHIAIGEGIVAPDVGDTALGTERERESAIIAYEASYKCVFDHTFTFGSGVSYSITEAGVLDQASGGTLLDRFTFSAKNVDSDTDLYVKITITVA